MSERVWARKQYLATADFRQVCEEAKKAMEGHSYCLIGGLAVAYHVNPPVTMDVDFLFDGEIEEAKFSREWTVAPLLFPTRQPGYPRRGANFRRKNPPNHVVDLLEAGTDRFLLGVLSRAVPATIQRGLRVPVITPEDLIVMKTLAGRDKDVEDIAEIEHGMGDKLDYEYIRKAVDRLL